MGASRNFSVEGYTLLGDYPMGKDSHNFEILLPPLVNAYLNVTFLEYSLDQNNGHPNNGTIRIGDNYISRSQTVCYLDAWFNFSK